MAFYNPDPNEGNDPFEGLVKLWERVKGFISNGIRTVQEFEYNFDFYDRMTGLAKRPREETIRSFRTLGQDVCEDIESQRQNADPIDHLTALRSHKERLPGLIDTAFRPFEMQGTQDHLAHGVASLVVALKPCEEVAIPVARKYIDLCPSFLRGHPNHKDVAHSYFEGIGIILNAYQPEQNVHRIVTRQLPDIRFTALVYGAGQEFDELLGRAYRTMDPELREAAESPYRDGSAFKHEP